MRTRRLVWKGTLLLLLMYMTLHLFLGWRFPFRSQEEQSYESRLVNDIHYNSLSTSSHDNQSYHKPQADIQMLQLYDELHFDNIDGGVWTQGWDIQYNEGQWSEHNKLKVFVVPHSHNDPGWKETFEDYYTKKSRSILNNMVVKLMENTQQKFIWPEISFFSLWWEEITNEVRNIVKLLISRKQLEIVTGGWVMNDEANAHYYSMIQQLTQGHQWMLQHLDVTPRYGWAIDPFGMSPTMPYLLMKMGIKSILIQRAHYSVKKYLARRKALEFRWRQTWDRSGRTDLLTHLMPFYTYDVPHTCGPDPMVCCQFDFKRLPGVGIDCPWGVRPQVITDSNVAHRAEMLLDQYRKKAQLYATNVVIAPLGADFSYDNPTEWSVQFTNYQKLFDYMNKNPRMNVQAQFGTLSDYFEAVEKEKAVESFPSLSGDFFTYCDNEDQYWSGYYTSRPFYKRMDRVLQDHLRSADLVNSLAWFRGLTLSTKLTNMLHEARTSLSLFQHHDGVSGTSRDHVVQDYATKMLTGINNCQHVIQQMVHYLLHPSKNTYKLNDTLVYFDLDHMRKLPHSLPEQKTLEFDSATKVHRVVFFNSLTWHRLEVVTLRVSSPDLKVTDWKGNVVQSQVAPQCQLFGDQGHCYDLSFTVNVSPLGMSTYFIQLVPPYDKSKALRAKIRVMNSNWTESQKVMLQDWVAEADRDKEFSIQNDVMSAVFSSAGQLKEIMTKQSGEKMPLEVSFVKYSARLGGSVRSGAYLFLPDGEGEILQFQAPFTVIIRGRIVSKVVVHLPNVQHTVILINSPGADGLGLEIQNLVDISLKNTNYELAMRLTSNIRNSNVFYTDLNGIQMTKRKTLSKLPLQANFYPMPTAIYIEDKNTRLSLLTGQPLGVASLAEGQIEVMQDRKLFQDDNRGLHAGIMDNVPTMSLFRLVVEEPEKEGCETHDPSLTTASLIAVESLNHPLHHLLPAAPSMVDGLNPTFRGGSGIPPGVDIHIVSLSLIHLPMKDTAVGLVLHRSLVNQCFPKLVYTETNSGKVNVGSLLSISGNITPSSLSFLYTGSSVSSVQPQHLSPFSILAYIIPKQSVWFFINKLNMN